jgi:hypothetical protein
VFDAERGGELVVVEWETDLLPGFAAGDLVWVVISGVREWVD